MDLFFGLQIAAIFLALLAHFTTVVREQLFGRGAHDTYRDRAAIGDEEAADGVVHESCTGP